MRKSQGQVFTLLPSVKSPLQMPSEILVSVELFAKVSWSQVSSSCWVREISMDAKWNRKCVSVDLTVVQAPCNKCDVLKGIRSIFTHFLS